MTCRDCRWLDVQPDKAGRRITRKDRTYRCLVEIPVPALPASVTKTRDFRWPPSRSYMASDDGEGCPMHNPVTQ